MMLDINAPRRTGIARAEAGPTRAAPAHSPYDHGPLALQDQPDEIYARGRAMRSAELWWSRQPLT